MAITTRLVPGRFHSQAEAAAVLLRRAHAESPLSPEEAEDIGVAFGKPAFGWLSMDLVIGAAQISWQISSVFDPFILRANVQSELVTDFSSWLHGVAEGLFPALFLEMEGPQGMMATFPAGETTRLLLVIVSNRPAEAPVSIIIKRDTLLRRIYWAIARLFENPNNLEEWERSTGRKQWARLSLIEHHLGEAGHN